MILQTRRYVDGKLVAVNGVDMTACPAEEQPAKPAKQKYGFDSLEVGAHVRIDLAAENRSYSSVRSAASTFGAKSRRRFRVERLPESSIVRVWRDA